MNFNVKLLHIVWVTITTRICKSEYKLEAWMGGFMMKLKLEMVQNVELFVFSMIR